MRLFPILLLSAAAGTSFAALSSQQTPPSQQPSPIQQKPTPQSQPSSQTPSQSRSETSQSRTDMSVNKHDDAFLAIWVLTANNNEVTLSQIAQQKAQNDEVKQFAQKMVTDHQQVATKLQQFTSGPGVGSHPVGGLGDEHEHEHGNPGSVAGSGNQPGSSGSGSTSGVGQTGTSGTSGQQSGRPVEAGLGHMGMDLAGNIDPIALITELGRQCLDSSRKELEQKQGAEFDRCYMGMAIGQHMAMNDMLTVFQNHTSGELRTTLADAQRSVQMHLEQAKQIAKRLEGSSPTSSSPTSQPGSR